MHFNIFCCEIQKHAQNKIGSSKIYHRKNIHVTITKVKKQNLPEPTSLPHDPNNQLLPFPKGNQPNFCLSMHCLTLWFHFCLYKMLFKQIVQSYILLCPASFAPFYVCEIYPGGYMQLLSLFLFTDVYIFHCMNIQFVHLILVNTGDLSKFQLS